MAATREAKVGVFVLVGLIVTGFVVFLIGDERRLFERQVGFSAVFHDVQGLKPGAPIRMGGIDIGTVGRIAYGDDPNDDRLYVDLKIVRAEAIRIREDAVALIANKGLLGDKMLEVRGGTSSRPPLKEGSTLASEEEAGIGNLMTQVGSMAQKAGEILNNLEVATKGIADEELQENVRGSVRAMHTILKHVAEGDGYAHRLLADPREADRLSSTLANFDRTSAELTKTVAEARRAMEQVNRGPGLAHEVLYGKQGGQAIAKIGEAASEVTATLKGIREGDGLAHAALYGGEGPAQELIANLSATSGDLRKIMADVRGGKGTLGALLVDPSIYEDMKMMLGNVGRNDVLRALVRYSIKQDEKRPEVRIAGPSSSPESRKD